MADNDALDHIAALLPEERRERFYAIVSRLRDMPEDDEILLIVEAIGFMTLLWREVPREVEAILIKARPADGSSSGTRETTAQMIHEVTKAMRETLDQPTYQDLRTLLGEAKEGQQAVQRAVKLLNESHQQPSSSRAKSPFRTLVQVALNGVVLLGIALWLRDRQDRYLSEIRSDVPAVETVVQTLGKFPRATISAYEGHDASLGRNVRAVVLAGGVEDAFVDEDGRGVVRLSGSNLSWR